MRRSAASYCQLPLAIASYCQLLHNTYPHSLATSQDALLEGYSWGTRSTTRQNCSRQRSLVCRTRRLELNWSLPWHLTPVTCAPHRCYFTLELIRRFTRLQLHTAHCTLPPTRPSARLPPASTSCILYTAPPQCSCFPLHSCAQVCRLDGVDVRPNHTTYV